MVRTPWLRITIGLCFYHSKNCRNPKCQILFCCHIKEGLIQQQVQRAEVYGRTLLHEEWTTFSGVIQLNKKLLDNRVRMFKTNCLKLKQKKTGHLKHLFKTIRVVSSSDKDVKVEHGMASFFVDNGVFPEEFPYRRKQTKKLIIRQRIFHTWYWSRSHF